MLDKYRLNHSFAVANKMIEIGKKFKLGESELQDLFILGYNHDIGYEFSIDKRLEDIKNRYGEDSKPYIYSKQIINSLKGEKDEN
jgi:HD superfamily phosphohydrolase YqeK